MDDLPDITRLLNQDGAKGEEALADVYASLYPRLRQLARSRRKDWHGNATMNTTALIHEAYLRIGREGSSFKNRGHFFASAAKAMRHALINYAEAQRAAKRGGGERDVTLYEEDVLSDEPSGELLALDQALQRLERMSERQARVVECLFFAGFTIDETAEALELSAATVKRDWSTARAWLFREMQTERGGGNVS